VRQPTATTKEKSKTSNGKDGLCAADALGLGTSEVVNGLRWLDFKDRKRFQDIKLVKVFDEVAYGFVKILEGLRGGFAPGSWCVEGFQKSLDDFERLMNERGMGLDACDSTKSFEQLRRLAREIDDEYASVPADIDSGGPTARVVFEAPKPGDMGA